MTREQIIAMLSDIMDEADSDCLYKPFDTWHEGHVDPLVSIVEGHLERAHDERLDSE